MSEPKWPSWRMSARFVPGPENEAGRFNLGWDLAKQGAPYPDEGWWSEHTTCNVYDSEEAQHMAWTEDVPQGWIWFHEERLVAMDRALAGLNPKAVPMMFEALENFPRPGDDYASRVTHWWMTEGRAALAAAKEGMDG